MRPARAGVRRQAAQLPPVLNALTARRVAVTPPGARLLLLRRDTAMTPLCLTVPLRGRGHNKKGRDKRGH